MNETRHNVWHSNVLGIDQPWEDRVVNYEEFCRLLVSSRKLLRLDEPQLGMKGLIDPDARVRFLAVVPAG